MDNASWSERQKEQRDSAVGGAQLGKSQVAPRGQAQAQRLKVAPPEKESATTPEPPPTTVTEKKPAEPPPPQAVKPAATKKSAYVDLFAQNRPAAPGAAARAPRAMDDYDTMAHLSSNENCWGPPESVMKAMNSAWKYSNRYGYPDGNLVGEIAKHHGVKPENVMIAAGSGEILDVVGSTFAANGKKVVGVEPSYSQVYSHVTSVKGAAITLAPAIKTSRRLGTARRCS